VSIEAATAYVLAHKDSYVSYEDDYCLCLLLKGVSLKYRGQHFQAKMCFEEIMDNIKNIKNDLYLLPWCEVELALLASLSEDWDNVKKHLDRAREYKGYALESRLHFRMHALSHRMKAIRAGDDVSDAAMASALEHDGVPPDLTDTSPEREFESVRL